MSPRFTFNKANLQHSLKVFGWSVGSAVVALLIAVMANIDVPEQYIFLVPIVNTLLVALEQYVREQSSQE